MDARSFFEMVWLSNRAGEIVSVSSSYCCDRIAVCSQITRYRGDGNERQVITDNIIQRPFEKSDPQFSCGSNTPEHIRNIQAFVEYLDGTDSPLLRQGVEGLNMGVILVVRT